MDAESTAAGDDHAPARRVGAVLGEARAAAGLDLADIARETRVPARHLAAIEADAHDTLPALPYAIGFVKAFARAVGLDAEAMGAQFRSETTKIPHVPAALPMAPLDERRLPPRGLVTVSLVAVLAVVGAVVAWSAGAFDSALPPATAPASVASAPVAVATLPVTTAAPPAATVAAPGSTPSTPAAAPAGTPVTVAAPPASTAAPAVAGASGVVITASDDAWFRISAYDPTARKVVTIKTGVLAKGDRYDVTATPGQRLWTGRAGALQISVDGRALPPLGGPVETVKNVSLDAVDLRARIAAAPATVTNSGGHAG